MTSTIRKANKVPKKIYINQLLKVFRIIFSLALCFGCDITESEKREFLVCFSISGVVEEREKKVGKKWKSEMRKTKKFKEGFPMLSTSITTSTGTGCVCVCVCIFRAQFRYGHIHKLIKMFNQSYAEANEKKKKSSLFFLSSWLQSFSFRILTWCSDRSC